MKIYLDESGELGFDPNSSKYYVVAAISVSKPKTVANMIRKFNGQMIKAGWPKDIEIKAARLFGASKDWRIPDRFKYKRDTTDLLFRIIEKVASNVDHIDIAVVKKDLLYPQLRELPFGVLHNYYCGQVLVPAIVKCSEAEVFVDRRNKEAHNLKHFNGYIETKVHERSVEGTQVIRFNMKNPIGYTDWQQ